MIVFGKSTTKTEELEGGQQDDTIYGDYKDHWIQLGARDVIYAGGGNDRVYGGGGDDKLYGQGGNDYLNGGYGNDYLNGGAGNDQLDGGHGNDYLTGEKGNDLFSDFFGNNTFFGGAGADMFAIGLFTDSKGKALTGVNTIKDFNAAEGDKLLITLDINTNYQQAAIDDYVLSRKTSDGLSTELVVRHNNQVNVIAKLEGITNFDIHDAIQKGIIVS